MASASHPGCQVHGDAGIGAQVDHGILVSLPALDMIGALTALEAVVVYAAPEGVVAGAADEGVIAGARLQKIVACQPPQVVGAISAHEGVRHVGAETSLAW